MKSEFTARVVEKAKQNPKSIVLPESDNEKVLLAARRILDLEIGYPILVGQPEMIEKQADLLGVSTKSFRYINAQDETFLEGLIQKYLPVNPMLSEKTLRRKFKTPLNIGAALVSLGEADCLAAGINHTTGDVILASQTFIGLLGGIETASSVGIVEAENFNGSEGHLLGIADCAVCQNPTSDQLADIAITTADTMKQLLNWEPRVAMLSFSTDGSSQHDLTEKVVDAVNLARSRRPGLLIDGEFQLDAALTPAVAAKKVKRESAVAGRANIIIFPDLNAGNIGVKLIQLFGQALAHGPLLQGFAKPVTDFSRSAPVDEIVGNLAMLIAKAGDANGK